MAIIKVVPDAPVVSTPSWSLIESATKTGTSITFTGLSSYSELMLQATQLTAANQTQVWLSIGNGNYYQSASGFDGTLTVTGNYGGNYSNKIALARVLFSDYTNWAGAYMSFTLKVNGGNTSGYKMLTLNEAFQTTNSGTPPAVITNNIAFDGAATTSTITITATNSLSGIFRLYGK
jgi:hypothetical protein